MEPHLLITARIMKAQNLYNAHLSFLCVEFGSSQVTAIFKSIIYSSTKSTVCSNYGVSHCYSPFQCLCAFLLTMYRKRGVYAEKIYLHSFSHNGLHGTLDDRSAVINLQIPRACLWNRIFKGSSLSLSP